ncbi:MAG TPA: hypothetical protein VE978_14780 [Chitinophagales bacterium]|nr:hypothetical protein [Chitinophagales bacterium]
MLYQEVLVNIGKALDKHKISYMVIVDDYPKLKLVLNEVGIQPRIDEEEKFMRRTGVLLAKENSTGIRVDLIFTFLGYEREAIKRSVEVLLLDYPVKFASKEDLIILKLVAGREIDLVDLKAILLKQKEVDEHYILKWLKEFSMVLEKDFNKIYSDLKKSITK